MKNTEKKVAVHIDYHKLTDTKPRRLRIVVSDALTFGQIEDLFHRRKPGCCVRCYSFHDLEVKLTDTVLGDHLQEGLRHTS